MPVPVWINDRSGCAARFTDERKLLLPGPGGVTRRLNSGMRYDEAPCQYVHTSALIPCWVAIGSRIVMGRECLSSVKCIQPLLLVLFSERQDKHRLSTSEFVAIKMAEAEN